MIPVGVFNLDKNRLTEILNPYPSPAGNVCYGGVLVALEAYVTCKANNHYSTSGNRCQSIFRTIFSGKGR